MLIEQGILTAEQGRTILGLLREIEALGPEQFPMDPAAGAFIEQLERYMSDRAGEDIAGRLHTGRSYIDYDAAVARLFARNRLLEVVDRLLALQQTLLDVAERHTLTIMPGYTDLQHAQPWTFGHYLLRHVATLDRDMERLEGAFARTNLSSLGGAALVGTSWPLDRQRVAGLLGHPGIVRHAHDAGELTSDVILEGISVLSIVMSNLARLAGDLYVWSSQEFGFVELADEYAGTSSIMPQKKNPHALERVKAVAGQAAGWLASMMGCQRGVCSTDLDFEFADNPLPQIGDATVGALRLMTEVVGTLTVHAEVMAAKAGAYWSTASHLADELVRRFDLPFRTAHHIVGRFVKDSIDSGRAPATATAGPLGAAARAYGAGSVVLSDREVREILDARRFVDSRATEGSVNPVRVRAHADALEATLGRHAAWLEEATSRVRAAIAELERCARALAGEGRG